MNIRPIPEQYLAPCAAPGRVERVDYVTTDAFAQEKYALVYLPHGYDPARAYNALYIIHGGGGSQESFFSKAFLSLLDHMIASGELEPLIVVSPTYYRPDETDKTPGSSGNAVAVFARELKADVIPAVEGRYRTFATSTDAAGQRASRDHRAIGGFSMGSVTTWYAFLDALDAFRWFMPLSGDCWLYGRLGGSSHAEETARALAEAVAKQGFTPEDFRIHALTGTKDIAYPNETAQIDAMRAFPEVFRFGGNIDYDLLEEGVHTYEDIFRYIYNALPAFFRAGK
ncbi:MAG: hypothetical protein IKO07_12125 [Clostridia bacterium]|nr:hypothetical protein [Clostridia bacterium]